MAGPTFADMTQQGVRWAAEQVLALAPDAASRKAGSKLGTSGPWSEAGCSNEGAVWGLCRGSGSKPYRTVVDTTGPAYQCSCPSRKFPCKHALGLLLLWSDPQGPVALGGGERAPDWARTWLAGRAERTAKKKAATVTPAGSEAARRRAEQRGERVSAGATELEQRLEDLLRGGLAAAEQSGYSLWEETAARMVDAQAPGLAARVRELGAIPGSGPGWPVRLLEETSLLYLLVRARGRQAELPAELSSVVGARLGLPVRAEGPPLRDTWLVLAQYDTADARLTTRRAWLHGTGSGRTALVLSYGAAGRAPELTLPAGLAVEAELTWFPTGAGWRAELGERFGAPAAPLSRPTGVDVTEALGRYGRAVREDPWAPHCPVTLGPVIPAPLPDGRGWQLAAPDGSAALPLSATAVANQGLWRLLSLSGGAPLTVFGECGHRGFTPLAAWVEGDEAVVSLS
ncbi:SWIM zinc finger containing protein [Streptomyces griseus]|uniref:SWIM zinc finger containing protein n=2 Tax=Streptomyces TaxID=1883 RepID=A0A380PBJ9_STRGR|nr:SWIM zinc finger containing protein [Streptomyces griseus]